MKRTNHTCKTSRYFERLLKEQRRFNSELYKKLKETETMTNHKVDLNAVNEVALHIDEMIQRKEKEQEDRLKQRDDLDYTIGQAVAELDNLRELARKHATLMPF